MTQWGFFEVAGLEAWAKLAQLQWKQYGTKLDEPTFLFDGDTKKPVSYPKVDEIEKSMTKVIGEISPNRTKGIEL